MGAILVLALLGMLLIGDWRKAPRRKWHATPRRTASHVVERTPEPESMDRYFTAAVLAGVIDKAHYRAKMAALAATTGCCVDADVAATVIMHAGAVRMITVAREPG